MKKFIAYFDILGYGKRINNKNIDEEYAIQRDLKIDIREIIEKNAKNRADFHTIHFSDTHIFYTNDNSEYAFEIIIKSSLIFMLLAAVRKHPYLPLRGVVNYGDFIADHDNSIFVGKGLREAYALEKNQEWMGCFLSDSCYKRVKDFGIFKKFLEEIVLVDYPVPLKTGDKNKYAINIESFPRIWGEACKGMPIAAPEFIKNIFVNKGKENGSVLDLDESAKRKMGNTIEFFEHIQNKLNNRATKNEKAK